MWHPIMIYKTLKIWQLTRNHLLWNVSNLQKTKVYLHWFIFLICLTLFTCTSSFWTYIHICQVPGLNTPNEGGIAFVGYTGLFFCNQHKWASLIKKVMHSLRTQKRVLFSKCFFHIVFLESLKLKKERRKKKVYSPTL